MADIRKHSAVLRELTDYGKIKIAGTMYNIETARIDFIALYPAPIDAFL